MSRISQLRAYHDDQEKRSVGRSYVDMEATYEPEGLDPIACFISDISPMGAMLRFEDTPDLPRSIKLRVPAIEMIFWADVKWRDDGSIGVRFTKSESAGR